MNLLYSALLLAGLLHISSATVSSEIRDPLNPFELEKSFDLQNNDINTEDDTKTSDTLIFEAAMMLEDEQLLEARSKLLKAINKDPKNFRSYMMLSGYYMLHVSHFRLALKYIKQAIALFEERYGAPPYYDIQLQGDHANLLYLLSQIRLNLDDYQGSLNILTEYEKLGYYAEWFPGTKAWVHMKLGNIEEAIKIAKKGVSEGAETGRTLNMLGILLSMNGEPDSALEVLKQATTYEFSLGKMGQPATPLNNSGEVYKEQYREDNAETSWLRAKSLPDGCEHVLPSLNLALLYIEELNIRGAKRSIDTFLECIAQYPLKNGEEHRALVNLIKGRLAYLTGNIDKAISLLEDSLENIQWFGKIGTNENDLKTGSLISLAQALRAKNSILKHSAFHSTLQYLNAIKERLVNATRIWWIERKALLILTEQLNFFEDLKIRNTDSMLEYPTLGEMTKHIPTAILESKLNLLASQDKRVLSQHYYTMYRAENLLHHGKVENAKALLFSFLKTARDKYDDALKLHAYILFLPHYKEGEENYNSLAEKIYTMNKASLRNYGLKLPVRVITSDVQVSKQLQNIGFLAVENKELSFYITERKIDSDYELQFSSTNTNFPKITVRGNELTSVVNKLSDSVFSENIDG
jgi:Tfp pilus assembly protein PilF